MKSLLIVEVSVSLCMLQTISLAYVVVLILVLIVWNRKQRSSIIGYPQEICYFSCGHRLQRNTDSCLPGIYSLMANLKSKHLFFHIEILYGLIRNDQVKLIALLSPKYHVGNQNAIA